MVRDTLLFKDASTHQIWDSYLKLYKIYALDTIVLKTKSEARVTVTRNWYATLRHPKMHPHIKFENPTSWKIRDMFRTQIWNSYLKEYRWYAPDSMQFLKNSGRGQVQGHSDRIMVCDTLSSQDASSHKIWDPNSNNIRDIFRTRLFQKLDQRSRSQWPENGSQHSVIPRYIHTQNVDFLPQRI